MHFEVEQNVPKRFRVDFYMRQVVAFLTNVVIRTIVDREDPDHEALVRHHLQHVELGGFLHNPIRIWQVELVGSDPKHLPFR